MRRMSPSSYIRCLQHRIEWLKSVTKDVDKVGEKVVQRRKEDIKAFEWALEIIYRIYPRDRPPQYVPTKEVFDKVRDEIGNC